MSWLIDKMLKFDDKTAIIYDQIYTYQNLHHNIKRVFEQISPKIRPGEVVAMICDYSFSSISLLFALYLNKNIIAIISSSSNDEINRKINEAYADKIIRIIDNKIQITPNLAPNKHKMIKQLNDLNRSGLILFSSGSTGKPKAMMHDFDRLIDAYQNKKPKNINMLIFLMFDHIGGINTLLNAISMGAAMIIPKSKDANEICALIQTHKISILPANPTFLNLLLLNHCHEKYNLNSLRLITYGTETMSESLLLRLKNRFKNVKFLQTFGTSETGISATSSKSSTSTYMKIGANTQYKIVNNELWLKSKTQIMGYLNAPMDSFSDDGWFKTGDIVVSDDEGYIKIIGRSKDIINVGGQKVFPNEVENVIMLMDEVSDCVVYGEKNAIMGQIVVCDIVAQNTANLKNLIRKFCKNRLDNYKIPTKINVVKNIKFSNRFKKIRNLR